MSTAIKPNTLWMTQIIYVDGNFIENLESLMLIKVNNGTDI